MTTIELTKVFLLTGLVRSLVFLITIRANIQNQASHGGHYYQPSGKNEWLRREPPGEMVRGINNNYSAGDFENSLWVMFFNPMESSARLLA